MTVTKQTYVSLQRKCRGRRQRVIVSIRLVCVAVIVTYFTSTAVAADRDIYIGLTKRQLVSRLGLPAQIELLTASGPCAEVLVYYWQDPRQGLQPADFQFQGAKVSGHPADFDAARLVSTETARGFDRVYRYVAAQRRRDQVKGAIGKEEKR